MGRRVLVVAMLVLGVFAPARAGDAPEWVTKGPGVFSDGALYAVGVAQGKGGVPILSRTADNRARANLAALIRSAVSQMTTDFESSAVSTDELVTRILVYEGSVEVSDLESSPSSFTLLGPGTRMMVVDGEGFGRSEPFRLGGPLEDWDGWSGSSVPATHDE